MNECKCNLPKKALKCETKCGLTIVIIPAQLGDSTGVYAPKIGDYKNTLVKYEADTKVFLYDKDGNWTLVGTSVVPGVTLDTVLSLASTNGVQNKVITKAINDANDSIAGVNAALADETYDRVTADETLQNNIDAVLGIMEYIYDNIMYAELNTKSDFCQECGYDGEIEIVTDEDGKLVWECPNCKNRDQSKMNVARRTCGYIGTQYWNQGRTEEIKERVLHL